MNRRGWWTDARVKELRQRHGRGESSIQIAAALGTTKDAVVSKAHRLRLYFRPPPIDPATAGQKQPARSKVEQRWVALAEATGANPESVRQRALASWV